MIRGRPNNSLIGNIVYVHPVDWREEFMKQRAVVWGMALAMVIALGTSSALARGNKTCCTGGSSCGGCIICEVDCEECWTDPQNCAVFGVACDHPWWACIQ